MVLALVIGSAVLSTAALIGAWLTHRMVRRRLR